MLPHGIPELHAGLDELIKKYGNKTIPLFPHGFSATQRLPGPRSRSRQAFQHTAVALGEAATFTITASGAGTLPHPLKKNGAERTEVEADYKVTVNDAFRSTKTIPDAQLLTHARRAYG